MLRTDEEYLDDIVGAAAIIASYVDGWSQEEFATDAKTQDAVMRRLEIIGEASRQCSDALRSKYPDVPWADIIGMRNIVMHAYHVVSLVTIWGTTTRDVPELVRLLSREPK